eukprot:TRINITY_DN2457_c0_g1_i3.p1 TRINITY_DN2457_c0_g1~~TRINITY_DN2457_c0_g1_i3.p1  ORF type:complete len:179 (-),score=19.14 TRINITY_DN2457_c0_g1_i3:288-824(-)
MCIRDSINAEYGTSNGVTMPGGYKKNLTGLSKSRRRGGNTRQCRCSCGKGKGMCRDDRGISNSSKGFGPGSLTDWRGRCCAQSSELIRAHASDLGDLLQCDSCGSPELCSGSDYCSDCQISDLSWLPAIDECLPCVAPLTRQSSVGSFVVVEAEDYLVSSLSRGSSSCSFVLVEDPSL